MWVSRVLDLFDYSSVFFFLVQRELKGTGINTMSSSPMKISLPHPRVMPVYYEKKNISTAQKKFSTKSIKVFNCK